MINFALILSLSAHAGDACDAAAIQEQLEEASPVAAARLYVDLANCDADAALAVTPAQLPRMLSGDEGYAALVKAISVGAGGPAVEWVDALQSDERASAIARLGRACSDEESVQRFFLNRAKTLGGDFWTQRWYSGLSTCHVASLQQVLFKRLSGGLGADRTGYFGVLETYARSSGVAAIPNLTDLALQLDDEEAQTYIVAAFADAAGLGSLDGMDQKAAQIAIESLVDIAPKLQTKAVEQARLTISSLGDEQAADALVGVRYRDLLQTNGTLLWSVVAVEVATCKNGTKKQRFHVASVSDPAQTWPDQLMDKVKSTVDVAWSLDMAKRCKGEGTVEIKLPDEPFVGKGEAKRWVEETLVRSTAAGLTRKPIRLDEPAIGL